MAQPPIYTRSKDFTVDYANESDHSAINNELDGAATSINAIRTNLALIQKDDGGLKNSLVTANTIHPDFVDALSAAINAQLGVDFALLSLGQYFKETFVDGVGYTAGATTQITLAGTPSSKANTFIHFDGVLQHQTEYGLSGKVVTFTSPIPSGVAQIEVGFGNTLSEGLIGVGAVEVTNLKDSIFNDLSAVSAAPDDYIVIADTSNSGNKRKALVSGLFGLIPSGTVTAAMLNDAVVSDLTNVAATDLDSVFISDQSDSGKKKKATVASILEQIAVGGISAAQLSDNAVIDQTNVAAATGDSVLIADVSDGNKKKRTLISSILSLISTATTAIAGLVRLGTTAETQAGALATVAVTPAGLAASMLGGTGQSYQNMTGSRAIGAGPYTNSTGRPILLSINCTINTADAYLTLAINGSAAGFSTQSSAIGKAITIPCFIVPNGATYQVSASAGTTSGLTWVEYR